MTNYENVKNFKGWHFSNEDFISEDLKSIITGISYKDKVIKLFRGPRLRYNNFPFLIPVYTSPNLVYRDFDIYYRKAGN